MNPGLRVLLVEDEPIDVMTVERAFRVRSLAGVVEIAETAEEALERLGGMHSGSIAATPLPDLILADLRLPRFSGIDLLLRVKADPRLWMIPVVMLSTSTQEADVQRAYAAGAAGYFSKPVEFEEFANSLQQIVTYWTRALLPSTVAA